MEQWAGIVMAAGMGVRMKSRTPKVLHKVCGKELVRYPVDLLRELGVRRIVVVVSPVTADAVRACLGDGVEYVTQPAVLGTADAAQRAMTLLRGETQHVIAQGSDAPLARSTPVKELMDTHRRAGNAMTILSAVDPKLSDFGRIVRDAQGRVIDIIEASDWPAGKPATHEVNSGVYCFQADWLAANLERIEPSGKGERYLPWLAGIGSLMGDSIGAVVTPDSSDILGINNRLQLAQVEAIARQRIRERWLLDGVTMLDPGTVYIDADVTIGPDTVILPNTMLQGCAVIGEGCEIGPTSIIRDSRVGDHCRVVASVIEESELEAHVDIGPFSHLRPGVYLETGVHIGNFSELKNSRLGAGTAMGHLGYVGDATIGPDVNLGAGLVTCNYDGKAKHRTIIGAGAFIGSDTMLVAPITIGEGAATGAGSVVTKDVPPGRLAVGVPARILEKKPQDSAKES